MYSTVGGWVGRDCTFNHQNAFLRPSDHEIQARVPLFALGGVDDKPAFHQPHLHARDGLSDGNGGDRDGGRGRADGHGFCKEVGGWVGGWVGG